MQNELDIKLIIEEYKNRLSEVTNELIFTKVYVKQLEEKLKNSVPAPMPPKAGE